MICGFVFRLLIYDMSDYNFPLVKTIQCVNCIRYFFCFMIDTVDDNIIISFDYYCKIEQ